VGSAGVRNGGGILHEYLPCGQGQFRQLTAPKQNPATFTTCAAWQCANWHWRSLLAITRRWPRQSPRLRCLTGTQPTWAAGTKRCVFSSRPISGRGAGGRWELVRRRTWRRRALGYARRAWFAWL